MIKNIIIVTSLLLLFSCDKSKNEKRFRIGVGNLNYQNQNSSDLSKSIVDKKCDVFICLEWTSKNLDKKYLKKAGYKFFLDHPRAGTHGICVIAKKKIKGKASVQKAPVKGPCEIPYGVLRIKVNDENVSILGIHAPPPVVSCKKTTRKTIIEFSKFVKNGKLIKNIGVGKKNDLVILAGDFNALPLNKTINDVKKSGLIDSYAKKNILPGPTWSVKDWLPAFLRIDYIFVSDEFNVMKSKRFKLPKSDHRAIVTEIILNKRELKEKAKKKPKTHSHNSGSKARRKYAPRPSAYFPS